MRRMTVAIAAALCFVGGLSAQEKPDCSGVWTATTGGPGDLCWQQCTITQDATSLTITRIVAPVAGTTTTFILDGSEHKVGDPRFGGATMAMWDGNKLRISIMTGSAVLGRAEYVFSMNAGQMEVEASITGAIRQVTPSKQTYKKN